jgi:hypothetical protein
MPRRKEWRPRRAASVSLPLMVLAGRNEFSESRDTLICAPAPLTTMAKSLEPTTTAASRSTASSMTMEPSPRLNSPSGSQIAALAINNLGEVAGWYIDRNVREQAFLAISRGGAATAAGFGDLLSAHASQGRLSNFLPNIPGINGGSPPAANP